MSVAQALRRDPALLFVVLCASFYFVSAVWLTRHGAPMPPDSLEYAEVARNLLRGAGYTVNFVEIHAGLQTHIRHLHELHGLLQPFVLLPFFLVFGPIDAVIHVPGLMFVALLSVTTYLLGKRVSGTPAGLVAGLLVLTRRNLAFDATMGGDDVGWAFFTALAALFFFTALDTTKRRWFVLAGVAAAFATLEKVMGVVLLASFAVVAVTERKRTALRLRDWASLTLPAVAALVLYAVRNYALHGGVGFRYSPLDWLSKDAPPAYFAYYERAPKLSEVFAGLGLRKVWALVQAQFVLLGSLALSAPFVFIGGPVALIVLMRIRPAFAWFGASYTVLISAVVCIAYHVEPRYLDGLFPIFFVAFGVLGERLFCRARDAPTPNARRLFSVALIVAGVAFVAGFASVVKLERDLGHMGTIESACEPAIEFLRKTAGPDDAVLTSGPWFVTWATERPSVNVPTNGTAAIARVVEYYDVKWAVDGWAPLGGTDVGTSLAALSKRGRLSSKRVFQGFPCSVYELGVK